VVTLTVSGEIGISLEAGNLQLYLGHGLQTSGHICKSMFGNELYLKKLSNSSMYRK
jgi:hypothetical protein